MSPGIGLSLALGLVRAPKGKLMEYLSTEPQEPQAASVAPPGDSGNYGAHSDHLGKPRLHLRKRSGSAKSRLPHQGPEFSGGRAMRKSELEERLPWPPEYFQVQVTRASTLPQQSAPETLARLAKARLEARKVSPVTTPSHLRGKIRAPNVRARPNRHLLA